MAIMALPLSNSSSPAAEPIQLAIPIPNAPGSNIHIHLTILATTLIVFLTTAGPDITTGADSALGSFIFAMPDRYHPTQPISTTLYTQASSLDFASRLAKVLVKKTGKAVHIGSSVTFASAAEGGSVEEEVEGFRRVVKVVVGEAERVYGTKGAT